jgi:hypothetical protein
MKRLDLLKAAPVAALVACGGGASQLVTPASRLLRPHPASGTGSGSCGVNYYQIKTEIMVSLGCEDGRWANATVYIEPKEGVISECEMEWCKKPKTACNYPNTTKIPFPWNGDINWLKNELIALWGAYGFIVDPKGNGGKLYYGDASYGNLVSEIAVNAKTYGSGSELLLGGDADLTLYTGIQGQTGQTKKVKWGYQGSERRRHNISGTCVGADINCMAAITTFAAAVFGQEIPVIGQLLLAAAILNLGAAAVQARADGCF